MSKTILHLDDEAIICELLASFLTSKGYRVISAFSATEALKLIQHTTPQLIICDLQLEDGDGLQAISRLKASLPETPVILLTGVLLSPPAIEEIVGKNVSAYLSKTAPLKELFAEIQRLIGS